MKEINRKILAIALPAIASNITTPLLGMIDTAIVGHIGSAAYIGAIAVGSSMFSMLYWLFGFLRMGSSGLTAQSLGKGDHTACNALLYRALAVGLVVGLLMILFSGPLGRTALDFLDADPATRSLAARYFSLVIYGAPAVMCTFALSGWLLGMQNSRTIMWMAMITNVVNIAVSFTLVFGVGMRIEGVAIGTVCAQWIGVIYGLTAAMRIYRPRQPAWHEVLHIGHMLRFFKINTDIFLRTVCLVAVTVWFTRSGARLHVDILAANALLMQLFLFFSYFMDGFAYAGEALSGKYLGMRSYDMLHRTVKALMVWSAMLSVLFAMLYLGCGRLIISLLTDNSHVLSVAMEFLPWIVAVPLVGVLAFVFDGIFIGMTNTRSMLISMLVATALFFGLYILLFPHLSNHGLWLAFIAYLFVRGIVLGVIYRRHSARWQNESQT
ncbi:MAG: MATE family efflux transporter [Muribaculaceae bacterium]|nr:MATE family efflux transporter [Muribaculaceae bacterium]MDE7032785.1 MATE family efflux transporter [Muribaculaceae bacterium]